MNTFISSLNCPAWIAFLLLTGALRASAALPYPADLLSPQARLTNQLSSDSGFGRTVALSGDLAAVGARDFSTNSTVHIFARQGTTWQRQAVVIGADTNLATPFGESVALDGDTLVVASPVGGFTAADNVQVFVRNGSDWLPRGMLTAGRAALNDAFGETVGISGDTLLVGAVLDSQRAPNAGAAYVFERSATPAINAWNITDSSEVSGSGSLYYLTNLTTAQYSAAAANGWRYAVTSRFVDDFTDTRPAMNFYFGTGSKRFLVWLNFNAAGDLQAELPGATPSIIALTTNGFNADAYHNHELVFNPTNGQATYYFDGTLIKSWAGETVASFGVSWGSGSTSGRGSMNYNKVRFEVLNGNVLANYDAGQHPSIATPPDLQGWALSPSGNSNVNQTGVSPDPSTWWSPRRKLTASDAAEQDFFGNAAAIDGDTLVIGASGDDDGGSAAGSAYVFVRSGNNWIQQAKLTANDRSAGDEFGDTVAIDGERIVVGAPGDDDGASGAGSAYVFERTGSNWTQQTKLTAADPAAGDHFGNAAALEGDTIVVGTENRGACYIFVRDGTNWVELKKHIFTENDATVWQLAMEGETIAVGVANSDGGDGDAYLMAPDFASETLVPSYVNKFLYYPNGTPGMFDKNIAAFRYKHLLYGSESNLVRARIEDMPSLYGPAERERADIAKGELLRCIETNPDSDVFGNLLLDIYYDRTVAETILAKSVFPSNEVARLGPPSVPGGLIIDDEIAGYAKVVETNRSVLSAYFALLHDDLGQGGNPPLGYLIFQRLVPGRALAPATYLTNGVYQPVVTNTVIIDGNKDLVLLFDFLRHQGRSAATLANLYVARGSAADIVKAKNLIDESQKSLSLQGNILLGIFPDLTLLEGDGSGLAEAVAGWRQALSDLSSVQQLIAGEGNPLGFQKDFLMLVQKFAGQSGDEFDSYDALKLRLDPNGTSNPLRFAKDRLSQARSSYGSYRGYQDQLETQLGEIRSSSEDRLFELVGAYPGENAYDTPAENEGSELWQQAQSIKQAQLRIRRNDTEINNLREQIEIEVWRSASLADVMIDYGVDSANLAQQLAAEQAAQDQMNTFAGMSADPVSISFSIAAGVYSLVRGTPQTATLEGDKELLAAFEQAEISEIESKAVVKTLLLGMRTLLLDSQEAALLLKQEWGRYAALLREKENLERTLAESDDAFSGRYFADPVHQLQTQHDTLLAHLSFEEARKWLYFTARALEYKWNTPFTNYLYLGRRWSTDTLFKLRNAEELELFYGAMDAYESQIQLPKDDYFDWFSVREDFFGYRRTNNVGQLLLYVDPETGETVNAVEAFRRRLRRLQDPQGNIQLDFSTVREVPGGTFFRGPRFNSAGQILSKGLFLDKIRWMKINLPGSHTLGRSQLAGELTYGGTSFIRNFDVGHFVPGRPDRLQNEMTAYSTRFWFFHASGTWRFREALSSTVTMQVSADPRVPPTVQELDIFKERSVATTGWKLSIPTRDLGQTVLNINELDDVELYFYHYAVTRP